MKAGKEKLQNKKKPKPKKQLTRKYQPIKCNTDKTNKTKEGTKNYSERGNDVKCEHVLGRCGHTSFRAPAISAPPL